MNINKTNSILSWGKTGYLETWDGYDKNYFNDVCGFILKELGKEKSKTTLEIGAGGGYWTGELVEHSMQVIALDVIDKPEQIDKYVFWLTRGDDQFNCQGISTEYIDFVFSFGTFCHFSVKDCEEYLKDINRVMKKGASGILAFGDSDKHPGVFDDYNNPEITIRMLNKHGFEAKSLIDFRDTLVKIVKK